MPLGAAFVLRWFRYVPGHPQILVKDLGWVLVVRTL
jgi:hypothetical protein